MKRLMKDVKEGDRIRFTTANGIEHDITVSALHVPIVCVLPEGYTNAKADHFELDGNHDLVEVVDDEYLTEYTRGHLAYFERTGLIDYWDEFENGQWSIVAGAFVDDDMSLDDVRTWLGGVSSTLTWKAEGK